MTGTRSILIRRDDLSGTATRDLLALHLAGMHASSPPGSVLALDLSGLQAPGVTVWTAWFGDEIAGIGALREFGDGQAELKSMRTHPERLRQGVARVMLEHLIGEARARGVTRVSLETGSGPAFEPAISLYGAHGFTLGGPFAGYEQSGFNRFLHRDL